MGLKTIYSNTEPADKNVIWLLIVDEVPVSKVFTANGWQPIDSDWPRIGLINLSEFDSPEELKKKLSKVSVGPFPCIMNGYISLGVAYYNGTYVIVSDFGKFRYTINEDGIIESQEG